MFRPSRILLAGLLAGLGAVGCHPSPPPASNGSDPLGPGEELIHADPEPAQVLHLVAMSRDGVFHTRRHANGAWDSFRNVEFQAGQIGNITGVEAQYTPGRLLVSAVNLDGVPWLTNRSDAGQWAAFTRARRSDGTDLTVTFMGLGRTGDANIHVCASAETYPASFFHGIWSLADGRFSGFRDVIPQTGSPGARAGLADCAGVGLELIYAAVASEGNGQAAIKMAVRRADGSWTGFTTTHLVDRSQGGILDLDLEPAGDSLHLVVTTTTTQLHALKTSAGWTGLADVESQAGNPGGAENLYGVSVTGGGAAVVAGDLHLSQVTYDYRVMHTIRTADGRWHAYNNILDVTGTPTGDPEYLGFRDVAMSGSGD